MSSTDWAVPGAKAAIRSGSHRSDYVNIVKIERLTATQIVIVGDARRYRRDNLHQVGDHYASELLPADDPFVIAALERAAVDHAYHKARAAVEKSLKWPQSREEAVTMLTNANRAISEALDALKGGADESSQA